MSNPTSRIAYAKYFEVFDRALDSSKGIRLRFDSREEAFFFRGRLHSARKVDRQTNAKTYEPGHPMHGCSPYDEVTVRAPARDAEGVWWLYIERNDTLTTHVEEITDTTPPVNSLASERPLTLQSPPVPRIAFRKLDE